MVRSIFFMIFSLWDNGFCRQILAVHIPPGAPPGGFLRLKPFGKTLATFWCCFSCYASGHQWGKGALLQPRQGFKAQRGVGT